MIVTDTLEHGFFGQAAIWILEVLPFLDARNTGLTCRIECRNYGVAPDFDCLAPYMDHLIPHHGAADEVCRLTAIKREHGALFVDFTTPNRLWNKYFAFKSCIRDEVDAFVASHFHGRTLGIHYRGSNKVKGACPEATPISYDEMDVFIEEYCRVPEQRPDTIFVASDEVDYVHHVQKRYGARFKVVRRVDSARNERDAPIPIYFWMAGTRSGSTSWSDADTIALGVDAIGNALLLSRCNIVLKTASALSAWSKIFNPALEVYRVNAFLFPWFPDAYIPLYRARDPAARELLDRTTNGEAGPDSVARMPAG